MEEPDEAQQQNMVSNLPLLFANGYPTSLEKISEKALETFIPFMVQCSLGNINLQGRSDISEPEWWPEDVPFSIPLIKPKKFEGNWFDKMKEIVVICYQFHKSIFLLKFCFDLAAYEPTRLRFINNCNSTTSLYDRRCNKLLVTFRNENMSYDQPQRNRKTLLQKTRSQTSENNNNTTQQMVEPPLFDIYLCDHCDAELYSLEANREHEKTCMRDVDDDDVIICESPLPEEDDERGAAETNQADLNKSYDAGREAFLLNFALQSRNIPAVETKKSSPQPKVDSLNNKITRYDEKSNQTSTKDSVRYVAIASRRSGRNISNDSKTDQDKVEKLKRLPRRNRAVYALSRCPTVPLSSPAGQLMIRSSKTLMTEDYLYERLDRMERFCHTTILSPGIIRPKFMSRKFTLPNTPVTFKKTPGPAQPLHLYSFPRRQFASRHRLESFLFLNSLLLKQCRPISIRLKKLNDSKFDKRGNSYFLSKATGLSRCSVRSYSSNSSLDCISIKSFPIAGARIHKRYSPEVVVDTIDLCSSDEDELNDTIVGCGTATVTEKASRRDDEIKHTKNPKHAQIISSEVTLTPISKSIEKDIEDIRKRNKFEGNFLVSQSAPTQPPKPLQPSVFLFSNYTTENIHLRHCTGSVANSPLPVISNVTGGGIIVNGCHQSTPIAQTEKQSPHPSPHILKLISNELSNNQENLERNSAIKPAHHRTSAPSSPALLMKSPSVMSPMQNGSNGNDWLPSFSLNLKHRTDRNNSSSCSSSSSSATVTNNGNSCPKIIQILTCADNSDAVLNKITSPPPSLSTSIDLTI